MNQEIALYKQELCWLLEQIRHTVDGLTEEQMHWRPAEGQANSSAAIIKHVLACTRVYVLGFGCGQLVSRNRSSEFTPGNGSPGSYSKASQQLADEIWAALDLLRPEELDESLMPPQELWGETEVVREITRREAFIMSIRHAALHLGELRLTSDLARQRI